MSEPTSPPPPPPPPCEPVRFYSEEELDEIEKTDPERAYRIARAQAQARRASRPPAAAGAQVAPPDPARVREAVEDVRAILMRDGGDIELVAIEGSVVRVRMKGACAGCPHSVIDLKNVVEKIVCAVPGVTEVRNVF